MADRLKEFFRVNVGGTLNLAKQALEAGVKRFIFISSIKVNVEASYPEQSFRSDDCPTSEDAYAISKRTAEVGFKKSFA